MLDSSIVRHPASPRSRSVIAAAVLAVTVLVATLGAVAQFHTLRGTLTDPRVAACRARRSCSSIRRRPAATKCAATRQDDSNWSALPTATYRLEVRLLGFRNHIEDLAVTGDVERTLQLAVGTLEETITVVGPGDGQPAAAPTRRARPDEPSRDSGPTNASSGRWPPARPGRRPLPAATSCRRSRSSTCGPEYPDAVRPGGVAGTVTMQAMIDTSGLVREVRDVRGPHPALARRRSNAVRAWEFTPTLLNCEAIEVEMRVTVNFSPR